MIDTSTDGGTAEALNSPFLLLPFRPDSDPSSARSFITNFFKHNAEGSHQYRGQGLQQELRLAEPVALCSIMKWCWSRMPRGVVTWQVYEGFKIGEQESHKARNAFHTFVPMTAGSEARTNIIYDFFDLLAAVAAHGKMNGLGGRKLSRLAGWWAFAHFDDGNGFEGGYKQWLLAADASSHLFFAYLRSLSPEADPSMSVIERIPRSLQALLAQTEYPPAAPALLQRTTPRVVMLVDSVSPTPFALLRRAKHFEYGEDDRVLRELSEFEDPVDALTDECKRVLVAISSVNTKTALSRQGNLQTDESWSTFQSLGFSDMTGNTAKEQQDSTLNGSPKQSGQGLRSAPRSRATDDHGRPTTPSWADFLSSGFPEDESPNSPPPTLLLPPDKQLPPIGSRTQTPNTPQNGIDENLAPGELAAVTSVELDDAFWWVWMTSLASEEHNDNKAVFGRCALIETTIMNGKWLIMEEQIKGASPEPAENVQFVEKKSRFGFTKRGRLGRKRSVVKKPSPPPQEAADRSTSDDTTSKASLGADQHAKIKAAAAELASRETMADTEGATRRGRHEDAYSTKTNSVLTMGMKNEADPAMKWAHAYDKDAIRKQYLGDNFAGRGMSRGLLASKTSSMVSRGDASSVGPLSPMSQPAVSAHPKEPAQERDLPALPSQEAQAAEGMPDVPPKNEPQSPLPAPLPPQAPEVQLYGAEEEGAQHQAEEQPLPETTAAAEATNPLDKETAPEEIPSSPRGNKVERKPVPVPRTNNIQDHPAFRQQSVDETPVSPTTTHTPAAIAAQHAMSSSPESQKPHLKPKKATGGGGFKKLFGRKKENSKRNSFDMGAHGNSSLSPPSDGSLGRRLSIMRKKTDKFQSQHQAAAGVPAQPAPETLAGPSEPVAPSSPPDYEPTASRVESQDREDAEHAFSRFDQGPMPAMPAAAPRDSTDDGGSLAEDEAEDAPSRAQFNTSTAARIAPQQPQKQSYRQDTADASPEFATPMERGDPITNDADSESSIDPPQVAAGGAPGRPSQDRWAQIRENAAKRAARASEEQSMQSRPSASQRTEDGETSGEESEYLHHLIVRNQVWREDADVCSAAIESRVARIKARVAELTGAPEGPASGR